MTPVMLTDGCCDQYRMLDFTKMEVPYTSVYWDERSLWLAVASIILTPIYWILVSLMEYHTHILRRLFCSRHVANFVFALTLIPMLVHRNIRFVEALYYQPKWMLLQENAVLWLGHALTLLGLLLVIRCFLLLGTMATCMGDFFGLLLPWRVTQFPYSWTNHPMYWGSSMMFIGIALADTSQAGLMLALLAWIMYLLAAWWEEQYTRSFYWSGPRGTRTVGVQVTCYTQLLQVPARTVSAQTGGAVTVISEPFDDFDFEIDDLELPDDEPAIENVSEMSKPDEKSRLLSASTSSNFTARHRNSNSLAARSDGSTNFVEDICSTQTTGSDENSKLQAGDAGKTAETALLVDNCVGGGEGVVVEHGIAGGKELEDGMASSEQVGVRTVERTASDYGEEIIKAVEPAQLDSNSQLNGEKNTKGGEGLADKSAEEMAHPININSILNKSQDSPGASELSTEVKVSDDGNSLTSGQIKPSNINKPPGSARKKKKYRH